MLPKVEFETSLAKKNTFVMDKYMHSNITLTTIIKLHNQKYSNQNLLQFKIPKEGHFWLIKPLGVKVLEI
jgi:hypothetical protein